MEINCLEKFINNFITFVPYWYTKFINMLVISTREFRQNQKEYFDRADNGEQIIVQRGKDKSYVLMPVSEDDIYFNPKMLERIVFSQIENEYNQNMLKDLYKKSKIERFDQEGKPVPAPALPTQ